MRVLRSRLFLTSLLLALISAGHSPCSADCSKLMLYGGRNHDVFLGCLSCDKYDAQSISNKYGDYGSNYATNSIWNKYGTFGSRFSDYSPWNKLASNPPVVVDDCGNYYGHLTTNHLISDQASLPAVLSVLRSDPFSVNTITPRATVPREPRKYYEPTPTDPKTFDDMVAPDEGSVALDALAQAILEGAKAGMAARQAKEARLVTVPEFESHIVGDFFGWTGKTKLKLRNGQEWKQEDKGSVLKVSLNWPRVILRQRGGADSKYYTLELYHGDELVDVTVVRRVK